MIGLSTTYEQSLFISFQLLGCVKGLIYWNSVWYLELLILSYTFYFMSLASQFTPYPVYCHTVNPLFNVLTHLFYKFHKNKFSCVLFYSSRYCYWRTSSVLHSILKILSINTWTFCSFLSICFLSLYVFYVFVVWYKI